jgi:drug/metabolite transporter (DMT)-like permease
MAIIAAFITCVLIWGSTWYGIELQLGIVPKEWSLAYRFGLAAIVMFLWCLLKREPLKLPEGGHKWALGTGLFFFSANYFMVYNGAVYLTSGLVAVAFSLMSFFSIFTGRIFLKNPIQLNVLLAASTGVLGLVLIFWPEISVISLNDAAVVGLAFCVAATLLASIGNTITGTESVKALKLFPFNAWGLFYGTLFNILFAVIGGQPPSFDVSAVYIISLIYLAVPGTVITFTIYIWLVNKIGIARSGYIAVMTPIVALTISTFLEGFVWTLPAILGLCLVIVGNIAINRSRSTVKA